MEATELTRLEKIANSLPCPVLRFERAEGPHGEIYFAYGAGNDGQIHGLWGHCGVAMTVDFKQDATVDEVRQVLVDSAHRSIEQFKSHGVLHG